MPIPGFCRSSKDRSYFTRQLYSTSNDGYGAQQETTESKILHSSVLSNCASNWRFTGETTSPSPDVSYGACSKWVLNDSEDHVLTKDQVAHLSPLDLGEVCAILRRFELEPLLTAVEQFSLTDLLLPSPLILIFNSSLVIKEYSLDSARLVISGAAPLTKDM